MVAVATRPEIEPRTRRRRSGWIVAAAAMLIVGLGVRLVIGGGSVGDRSAAVMMTLLVSGAWLASVLLGRPRLAFMVALIGIGLLDLAALPVRNAPEYDDREAFYRLDQTLAMQVPVDAGIEQAQQMLTVLVEPNYPSADTQPSFGLAGTVGDTPLTWTCVFRRGIQRLALPVPPGALRPPEAATQVRLHLTGSPNRESEYLLVYSSSERGGFLVALVGASQVGQATLCGLA